MPTFDYRRKLSLQEHLPAVGAGVGAGVAVGTVVFYLARLMLQRTPLRDTPAAHPAAARGGEASPFPSAPVRPRAARR
ncbi:MAG TPA: hypothetical protein VGR37_05170 [Longimicrobiaceae bacterium]|nr:hypothetical protein [Longimicrobiaceae bacterium]